MTTRTIFSSIALLVLLGAATACDSDLETSSPSTTATTSERTTTTREITTTTEDSGGTDSGGTDGGTDITLPGGITIPDDLDLPDISVPEDVKKDIEDALGKVGDCASLAVSYGKMVGATILGTDSVDFEQIRSDLKAEAPSDVDSAIDVVVDVYTEVRSQGITEGGDAMSSTEFENASDTVNEWLKNSCGG